jgi:hypothetical protein
MAGQSSYRCFRLFAWTVAVLLVAVLATGSVEAGSWKIESKDKERSIKFGFLVQGWAKSIDSTAGDTEKQMYFGRLRLLAGGKLSRNISFFMETDSLGLGKANVAGERSRPDVYIQDFVVTFHRATSSSSTRA